MNLVLAVVHVDERAEIAVVDLRVALARGGTDRLFEEESVGASGEHAREALARLHHGVLLQETCERGVVISCLVHCDDCLESE